jgi:D-sedoheptulose 7-phosphate isomerase
MSFNSQWSASLQEGEKLLKSLLTDESFLQDCAQLSRLISDCLKAGGTLLSCGNGGSHTQAIHFAEEWTGRFRKDRKAVAALALGESSHMSCVGNDYGFDHVFSRQVEALARKGDLLLLFTTSGNSKNLTLAAEAAKAKGVKTVGILGRDGGLLKSIVDHAIVVPAQSSDRIQEIHLKILHIAIETVERELFPENY